MNQEIELKTELLLRAKAKSWIRELTVLGWGVDSIVPTEEPRFGHASQEVYVTLYRYKNQHIEKSPATGPFEFMVTESVRLTTIGQHIFGVDNRAGAVTARSLIGDYRVYSVDFPGHVPRVVQEKYLEKWYEHSASDDYPVIEQKPGSIFGRHVWANVMFDWYEFEIVDYKPGLGKYQLKWLTAPGTFWIEVADAKFYDPTKPRK